MKPLRLLLADDQAIFVHGLRRVIEMTTDEIEIIGVAATGTEAVDLALDEEPDVVLMDVRMPNTDGVEATRLIHDAKPEIDIIMLTTFDDDDFVHRAIKFGAKGYLLKDIPPDDLIKAVRNVNEASVMISPGVVKRLFADHESTQDQPSHTADATARIPEAIRRELTPREEQIVHLMLDEYDNRSIAEQLSIAERTVRNYVSVIYDKLGVGNRFEMIRFIREPLESNGHDVGPD